MDEISGVALALKTGVPSTKSKTACRAEGPPPSGLRRDKLCRRREEGRTHLLIHLGIEEDGHRWCLWRPDQAGFDSRSIFEGALVED